MSLTTWYCIMAFVSFTAGVLLMWIIAEHTIAKYREQLERERLLFKFHMDTHQTEEDW